MNFPLLKNFPFMKRFQLFSAKRAESLHQQMVAQRDWIRILVGAAIIGFAMSIQSIFIFLGANTDKSPSVPEEGQPEKQVAIFDRQEVVDIRKFFQTRENELKRLRAAPPSTNDPAVVVFTTATSSEAVGASN